jgi:chromosome segregation ATPase
MLFLSHRRLRVELSNHRHTLQQLQSTHDVENAERNKPSNDIARVHHDLQQTRAAYNRVCAGWESDFRKFAVARNALDTQVQDLKQKVKLLEAISTLNASGLTPRSLEIHGYQDRIDSAVSTWTDVHSQLVDANKQLSHAKAETTNARRALALSVRSCGIPISRVVLQPREELSMKSKLFNLSLRCEMYFGQLQEAKEARRLAAEEVLAEKHKAEGARKDATQTMELYEAAITENEELTAKLEFNEIANSALRSWVQNLLDDFRNASAPSRNEFDANVGNIRTSKSLPHIAFPFTPTLEPMEADISSIPASIGISDFLSDWADEENSPSV